MKKGFTLIELFVAMILLSVVMSFAVPRIRYYERRALRARVTSELRLLSAALKIYQDGHKSFPAEKDYQKTLIAAKPQVLEVPLADPFSDMGDSPYVYQLSPNHKYYLIYSVGSMGNTKAVIMDTGKIFFTTGDPRAEKWISNGKL